MGDGDYMYAFQQVVMPIAHEFNPDLVIGEFLPFNSYLYVFSLTTPIVSAGFDAAVGDDLGGCFVTPACYAHMTHLLMSLAGGKVAVCLEVCFSYLCILQESQCEIWKFKYLVEDTWDQFTSTSGY